MNATAKVSNYLAISEHLLEVREWAFVYWVHVEGQRPTMISKKIVDRYSELEVLAHNGDTIIRDGHDSVIYIVRSAGFYTGGGASVKRIQKGERVSANSEFPMVKGETFRVGQTSRPATVLELIAHRSYNAA